MASSSVITSDMMPAPSSSLFATTSIHANSHVDSSPQWTAHMTMPSSAAMDSTSYSHPHHRDSALTSSPQSRTTGLPLTVSSSPTVSSLSTNVAISSSNNPITYNNSCQNAPPVLNFSASSASATRLNALSSTEPQVPNYSTPYHGLNNSPTRPRTSDKVFSSTTDLAAHYGIPTNFPPLPNIKFRPLPVTQPSTAVTDFFSLKDNYLSMLSQKSDSTPAQSSTDMSSATVSPADLQQSLGDFTEFEALIRGLGNSSCSTSSSGSHSSTPAQDNTEQANMSPFEPNDYLTSPWTPSLDTFGDSPGETPLSDFLNTPLIADNDIPLLMGAPDTPLFGDSSFFDSPFSEKPTESSKPLALDTSGLLTLSPTSPYLDTPALNPASLVSPSMPMTPAFPLTHQHTASPAVTDMSSPVPTAPRRRAAVTGTRKNITADSLVPLDAPTQTRRYVTPSATSRKELPAVFARKRARVQMLDGEEDELDEPLKPNATELEQIEWKRRQNTLAARKSRHRKLVHQQTLEAQVAGLSQEREKWKQRALTLQGILQANGIPFGDFQD